jgi:branched-chain amino acid transport system permease protein
VKPELQKQATRWAHVAGLAAIWAALILAPLWMPLFGGYTALGSRVLVLGLAAMSVNFLLGFTGVLSFGHAAWFGLGAYGTGFVLKWALLSTPVAVIAGTLLGGLAGALLGALLVRRRGVYFAMVTIAFGQVFYYIAFQWSSVTGGDDGRADSSASLSILAHSASTSCITTPTSTTSPCSASPSPSR